MADREKPIGHDLEECCSGRLRVVAPEAAVDFGRKACLGMNALAATIATL